MAGFVERTAQEHGIEESLWMTVGVSDGQSIWAVRYASDGEAPTLYYSRDAADVGRLNPEIIETLGPAVRVVVSEPIGRIGEVWMAVPQATSLEIRGEQLTERPFVPTAPAIPVG
jgi:glutamine amidotransferase